MSSVRSRRLSVIWRRFSIVVARSASPPPRMRSTRESERSRLRTVLASFGSPTSVPDARRAAAASSGSFCSAGLASVFCSSAFDSRSSASSATASSDSFFAAMSSSVGLDLGQHPVGALRQLLGVDRVDAGRSRSPAAC